MAATPHLVLKPSPIIMAPKPKKQSSSRGKSFSICVAISLLSTKPVPRCLISTPSLEPISALSKENEGFGGDMNRCEFWGSNSCSYWADTAQTDEKFQCQVGKKHSVAETEDDMQSEKREIRASNRTLGNILWPNIYKVAAAACVCMVLGGFSFINPHQHASRHMVVSYSDLVDGFHDGSVIRHRSVEFTDKIYFNTGDQVGETCQSDTGSRGLTEPFVPKGQYHTSKVGDDKYQLIGMPKDKVITYGLDPELFSESVKKVLCSLLQLFGIMVVLSCNQLDVQLNLGRVTKRKPSKKQSVTCDDAEGVGAAITEPIELNVQLKRGRMTKGKPSKKQCVGAAITEPIELNVNLNLGE